VGLQQGERIQVDGQVIPVVIGIAGTWRDVDHFVTLSDVAGMIGVVAVISDRN